MRAPPACVASPLATSGRTKLNELHLDSSILRTHPTFFHTCRTPIHVNRLRSLLRAHPDQAFVKYVHHGLTYGFDIGFNGPRQSSMFSPNLPSARMHPDFITKYLQECCSRFELLGPFSSSLFFFFSLLRCWLRSEKERQLPFNPPSL